MDNPIAADAFGVHHATTILGNLQMQGASRTLPENVEVLSAQSAIQPCPWRTSVCSTKTRRTCPDPTWSKLRSIRCHRLPTVAKLLCFSSKESPMRLAPAMPKANASWHFKMDQNGASPQKCFWNLLEARWDEKNNLFEALHTAVLDD